MKLSFPPREPVEFSGLQPNEFPNELRAAGEAGATVFVTAFKIPSKRADEKRAQPCAQKSSPTKFV